MCRVENYHKKKKVEVALTYVVPETEIFAVRFDPEDKLVALGTLDGVVKVYHTQTSVFIIAEIKLIILYLSLGKTILNLITSPLYTPATCLR